jgi:hypothetical protein
MSDYTVMVRLLGSIREHLNAHRIPTKIACVEAGCDSLNGEHVTVQLRHAQLADLAAALLNWADTLTHVTVTAWRPLASESVHLILTGQLADGTRVTVYGGVDYADALFGDLQPGGRYGVALSVMRGWVAGGEAVAA